MIQRVLFSIFVTSLCCASNDLSNNFHDNQAQSTQFPASNKIITPEQLFSLIAQTKHQIFTLQHDVNTLKAYYHGLRKLQQQQQRQQQQNIQPEL